MLHILYCCYNNYDLLIGENKNFLKRYSSNIVFIDDHSIESEFVKGKSIANRFGIKIFKNPGKGIQSALDAYIRQNCNFNDWVLIIQQDVFFRDKGAIERLEKKVKSINNQDLNVAAFGFPNYIPNAHYHDNISKLDSIDWKKTWLGVFSLSNSNLYRRYSFMDSLYRIISKIPFVQHIEKRFWHKVIINRNFAPKTLSNFKEIVKLYEGFVSIDLPVWTAVVISCNSWKKSIIADKNFIFHLWFPDIAMQFMNNEYYICLDTSEIVINNWKLKEKYGILDSVNEGKKKNGRMEKYGNHFKVWHAKWGFDYEDPNEKSLSFVKYDSILHKTIKKTSLKPLAKFYL